ncbi:hypothetical protein CMI47_19225 [Candidatus Pacearchaeota archaeon]|nr:hypothetical protein [Candidatus Pacearchaeota archaeon]|tara:strand:+ start:12523 stop:12759 length:237 start_codon:yes stop_codon:yes gene_type:complete
MSVGDLVMYNWRGFAYGVHRDMLCPCIIMRIYAEDEKRRILGKVHWKKWESETMYDVLIDGREMIVLSSMLGKAEDVK